MVGKNVRFETRKQGASAGDRVYGCLWLDDESLGLHVVKHGWGTPKSVKYPPKENGSGGGAAPPDELDNDEEVIQLVAAYQAAQAAKIGIHADHPVVRTVKNAGDDFALLSLVEACQRHAPNKRLTAVIEYIFDGSRLRCQITDSAIPEYQFANFTLLLGGITAPRMGNPKAEPPMETEAFAHEAKQFVTARLLQRELPIGLLGTDKSASCAVGTVYHPVGNIAVELLKVGLARMTDWSVRLLPAGDVSALRVAENQAKRTQQGVWQAYAPPVLQTASKIQGQVVEVLSGDTVLILPTGKAYMSEDDLIKLSLASIRAPRLGSERAGRADEPYALECKDMLRNMTIGKDVAVEIHYERDIPLGDGTNEKRPFGSVAVPGKHEDVSIVLVTEGLATTQRHRDEDEKSPRYDALLIAEAAAKAAKKGVHKNPSDYKGGAINDLTDPRKAKAYSGSLMRAGKTKGVVDFVFNGALFKILIPAENCYIRFSPNFVRCPQPSPSPGSKQQNRPGEPFGDEAKRHARLHLMQRQVEIVCTGVTNSGIIVGSMSVGQGKQFRDYTIELLGAGLATVDQRKIDFGEAPRALIDAQASAQENKVGLWTLAQPETQAKSAKGAEKAKVNTVKVRLSEIRTGTHFFYHVAGDESAKVMDDSMKAFTRNNGTAGAPCDVKVGKVLAALFDDGSGKSWYRAKILERKGPGKVSVLFIDHGNVATVPVSTHLRPLDTSLGVERIPAIAKEAVLALVVTRPLTTDEGMDAARFFQSVSWGKELTAKTFAVDDTGRLAVALSAPDAEDTINEQLVAEGLARVAKPASVDALVSRMIDGSAVVKLADDLNLSQETARKSRSGMWRYGDIGDEDPDDI